MCSRGLETIDDAEDNVHKTWYKDPSLRLCMFNVMILYGSVFAYGYDNAVIGSVQALPYWETYVRRGVNRSEKLKLTAISMLLPVSNLV